MKGAFRAGRADTQPRGSRSPRRARPVPRARSTCCGPERRGAAGGTDGAGRPAGDSAHGGAGSGEAGAHLLLPAGHVRGLLGVEGVRDAPRDEHVELQPEPLLPLLSLQALLLLPALAQHRRAGAGCPCRPGLPAPRVPGRLRQRARRAAARRHQHVPPLLFQQLIGLLLAGGRVQHRARRARPAAGHGARRGAARTFPDTSSLHTDCFRPAAAAGRERRGGEQRRGLGRGVEPGLPWELLRAAPGGGRGGTRAGLTSPPAPASAATRECPGRSRAGCAGTAVRPRLPPQPSARHGSAGSAALLPATGAAAGPGASQRCSARALPALAAAGALLLPRVPAGVRSAAASRQPARTHGGTPCCTGRADAVLADHPEPRWYPLLSVGAGMRGISNGPRKGSRRSRAFLRWRVG